MKNLPEIKKKGVLRSWFWPEKMQGLNVMLMPVYFVPQGMAQAQVPSFAVTEAASEPGSSSSPELSSVPESAPAEEVAERSPGTRPARGGLRERRRLGTVRRGFVASGNALKAA